MFYLSGQRGDCNAVFGQLQSGHFEWVRETQHRGENHEQCESREGHEDLAGMETDRRCLCHCQSDRDFGAGRFPCFTQVCVSQRVHKNG